MTFSCWCAVKQQQLSILSPLSCSVVQTRSQSRRLAEQQSTAANPPLHLNAKPTDNHPASISHDNVTPSGDLDTQSNCNSVHLADNHQSDFQSADISTVGHTPLPPRTVPPWEKPNPNWGGGMSGGECPYTDISIQPADHYRCEEFKHIYSFLRDKILFGFNDMTQTRMGTKYHHTHLWQRRVCWFC